MSKGARSEEKSVEPPIDIAFAKMLNLVFSSEFEDRIDSLVKKVESKEIDTDRLFVEITTVCTEFTDAFQRALSYLIIKKMQTGHETKEAITRLLDSYLKFYDMVGRTFDWNRFPIVSPYDKIWDVCYSDKKDSEKRKEISSLLADPERLIDLVKS